MEQGGDLLGHQWQLEGATLVRAPWAGRRPRTSSEPTVEIEGVLRLHDFRGHGLGANGLLGRGRGLIEVSPWSATGLVHPEETAGEEQGTYQEPRPGPRIRLRGPSVGTDQTLLAFVEHHLGFGGRVAEQLPDRDPLATRTACGCRSRFP